MFEQTTILPLSLTPAAPRQKLDELQAMNSDDLDLVSKKIKFLLDIQFPRSRIVRALPLIHSSEPTRLRRSPEAVVCWEKKKNEYE